jgi:hypothetical protein
VEFSYAYRGSSQVADHPYRTAMSFAPDTLRQPTYFRGELRGGLAFREAISALHDVVVSDLRYKPRDRTAYKEWLARQEEVDWMEVAAQRGEVKAQIETLQRELTELRLRRGARWDGFYKARKEYFSYLYKRDIDAWFVLDPVITVHPDEVFFECFSQDESSYGRLGAGFEVFQNIGEMACGTTNIDYSQALYDEFQKIRSYKSTSLEVDPTGFEVQTTAEESYREVKIDLPDSWVRGFLQVSSAMSLPATSFELHPMDVYNICLVLRRHRELLGPRSLRYHLTPGQPVRVSFDPWGIELSCPRSTYAGDDTAEIRVWGRRRLHILERLIPVARRFTVHLLGSGMPSFYVADLGEMSFTLGLSGWTANDWAAAGNFDLMAPRATVDDLTKRRVFDALKETWRATSDDLATRLQLDRSLVLGALGAYAQAGRAIYDLNKRVYRVRELSREPLPLEKLRFASEREQQASELLAQAVFSAQAEAAPDGTLALSGRIGHGGRRFETTLAIDADQRLVRGTCSCPFFVHHQLHKGPCEHMLALRLYQAHRGRATPASVRAQSAPSAPSSARATTTVTPVEPLTPGNPEAMMARTVEEIVRRLSDAKLIVVHPERRDRLLEQLQTAGLERVRPGFWDRLFRREERAAERFVEGLLSALLQHAAQGEVRGSAGELRAVMQQVCSRVVGG